MKVIGITGGVGAGKSAVLTYIREHYNAGVLVADEIAHDLMRPGTEVYIKLREIFPDEVFGPDGEIVKEALSRQIFSDDRLRLTLNGIVHPAVGD